MSIGNKIYEMRIAKKLSQSDLADLLDVSRQSVSKWETDAAVPDLDKLVKLCDVFEITVDELIGRNTKVISAFGFAKNKNPGLGAQKILGCILLGIALVGTILTILLADHSEDMYILIPILLSTFLSGLICLGVKKHCGYWCAWSVLAAVTVLTPHLVILPFLGVIGCVQIVAYIIMTVIASRIFDSAFLETTKLKLAVLILGWVIGIAVYITSLVFVPLGWISFCIVNFSAFFAIAILLTYTVCYVKNIKKNKQ